MGLWLAIAVIVLTIGSLLGRIVWLAHLRRKRSRSRQVEAPNSYYTPQLVRNREDLDRWENIPLEKVHEINRGEVRRLVDKAKAAGAESLRPNERQFLDHMALVTGPDRGPDGAPLRKEPAVPARPQQPPRPPDLTKPSEARP